MFRNDWLEETICLLSKLSEAKSHISVKVEMDEMDLTAAESKATYEEIQEWVQEKVWVSCDTPEYRPGEAEIRYYRAREL